MSHFYILLEFSKIFNWNEKVLEVRIVGNMGQVPVPQLDKKMRGQLQDECLKFKIPLKLTVQKPSQLLKLQIFTSTGKSVGTVDMNLDINITKQKIHYLPIVGSDNKILQVNSAVDFEARVKTPGKDIISECERVVHETMQKKMIANIELKRNDQFIRNREKFLTEYSRSKSRSNTRDFPTKISNLLQEVRQIKNAIRVSSSRSNSRVLSRQNGSAPLRVSSLQRIQEKTKPKLIQRTSRQQLQPPQAQPRRIYPQTRGRYAIQTKQVCYEYGIRNRPQERRPMDRQQPRLSEQRHPVDRSKDRSKDRNYYIIRKPMQS